MKSKFCTKFIYNSIYQNTNDFVVKKIREFFSFLFLPKGKWGKINKMKKFITTKKKILRLLKKDSVLLVRWNNKYKVDQWENDLLSFHVWKLCYSVKVIFPWWKSRICFRIFHFLWRICWHQNYYYWNTLSRALPDVTPWFVMSLLSAHYVLYSKCKQTLSLNFKTAYLGRKNEKQFMLSFSRKL